MVTASSSHRPREFGRRRARGTASALPGFLLFGQRIHSIEANAGGRESWIDRTCRSSPPSFVRRSWRAGRNDEMSEHAVVIVGAGPTGLMLAGELALAKVDVAVV